MILTTAIVVGIVAVAILRVPNGPADRCRREALRGSFAVFSADRTPLAICVSVAASDRTGPPSDDFDIATDAFAAAYLLSHETDAHISSDAVHDLMIGDEAAERLYRRVHGGRSEAELAALRYLQYRANSTY